jgi:hypothetical protein
MNGRPWKHHRHSDEAAVPPPKYWPGDPIVAIDDHATGRVEFARHDRQVCVVWDHSGRREWLHEDALAWPPSFQPMRRR